jgi:hypothetical protein
LVSAGVCRENLHGINGWRSCGNASFRPSLRSRLSGRWPFRPSCRRFHNRHPPSGWVSTSFPFGIVRALRGRRNLRGDARAGTARVRCGEKVSPDRWGFEMLRRCVRER